MDAKTRIDGIQILIAALITASGCTTTDPCQASADYWEECGQTVTLWEPGCWDDPEAAMEHEPGPGGGMHNCESRQDVIDNCHAWGDYEGYRDTPEALLEALEAGDCCTATALMRHWWMFPDDLQLDPDDCQG